MTTITRIRDLTHEWSMSADTFAAIYEIPAGGDESAVYVVAWGRGYETLAAGEVWTGANTPEDGAEVFSTQEAAEQYADDVTAASAN